MGGEGGRHGNAGVTNAQPCPASRPAGRGLKGGEGRAWGSAAAGAPEHPLPGKPPPRTIATPSSPPGLARPIRQSLALTTPGPAEAGTPCDVTRGAAKGRGPCSALPSPTLLPARPRPKDGSACAVATRAPATQLPARVGAYQRDTRGRGHREGKPPREEWKREEGQGASARNVAEAHRLPPERLARTALETCRGHFWAVRPPPAPIAQPNRARVPGEDSATAQSCRAAAVGLRPLGLEVVFWAPLFCAPGLCLMSAPFSWTLAFSDSLMYRMLELKSCSVESISVHFYPSFRGENIWPEVA